MKHNRQIHFMHNKHTFMILVLSGPHSFSEVIRTKENKHSNKKVLVIKDLEFFFPQRRLQIGVPRIENLHREASQIITTSYSISMETNQEDMGLSGRKKDSD